MALRVVDNATMVQQEREEDERSLEERQNEPLFLGITAHLKECWDAAKQAKKPIERIMLKAMRQRNGEYEPDKLSAIHSQGGSTIYMGITEVKCRAAESWLRDILLDTGTPPWDLGPTPLPDLSPTQADEIEQAFAASVLSIVETAGQAPTEAEMAGLKEMVTQDYRFKILQEAQNRADRMKVKISDQFAHGGWAEAFDDFITDLATFPCAFIKGPVVRRQRRLEWATGENPHLVSWCFFKKAISHFHCKNGISHDHKNIVNFRFCQ